MTKHARIQDDGLVLEICTADPATLFVEEIASQFVAVPETVEVGDVKKGNTFQKVEVALPPEPEARPKVVSQSAFYSALSSAERIALRSAQSTDALIDDFLMMLETTGNAEISSADGVAALAHFKAQGYISAGSVDKIKALAS